MTRIPVLVRSPSSRKDKCEDPSRHPVVELFLPYESVNRGYILSWTQEEGHNEAHLSYYQETIPPHGHMAEAERLLERYKALHRQAGGRPSEIVLRHRLPNDWREHAWEQI